MNKIDWTKWSAIAEIGGAIAIVVTLLYLATQTQYLADQTEQNNRILRASAANDARSNRQSLRELVITDSEFAEFYERYLDREPLSDVDESRFRAIFQWNFLNWQHDYRLFLDGSLAPGEFSESGIRATICSRRPGMREEWSSFKAFLWPEFVHWMDQNILTQCE